MGCGGGSLDTSEKGRGRARGAGGPCRVGRECMKDFGRIGGLGRGGEKKARRGRGEKEIGVALGRGGMVGWCKSKLKEGWIRGSLLWYSVNLASYAEFSANVGIA